MKIAVDGSCIGNPGYASYRGVDLNEKTELFHVKLGIATNNIAEFLAVVHAMAIVVNNDLQAEIYTDSTTAIAWVKHKQCNTTYQPSEKIAEIIQRAEKFLREKNCDNVEIKKWDTRSLGEIPADFGNK